MRAVRASVKVSQNRRSVRSVYCIENQTLLDVGAVHTGPLSHSFNTCDCPVKRWEVDLAGHREAGNRQGLILKCFENSVELGNFQKVVWPLGEIQ
jgi:hypothetical protein